MRAFLIHKHDGSIQEIPAKYAGVDALRWPPPSDLHPGEQRVRFTDTPLYRAAKLSDVEAVVFVEDGLDPNALPDGLLEWIKAQLNDRVPPFSAPDDGR